jgi:hypothetical protein
MGWPADLTWYKLFTDWGSLIGGIFALIAAGLLYHISRRQFNLARAEFISSHRPRIIIRNITTRGFVVGLPIEIAFTIVNIGDSNAIIKNARATTILISRNKKTPRHLTLTECNVGRTKLAPGETEVTNKTSKFVPQIHHVEALQKNERLLCIVGCVRYSDENGVDRATGFLRYCDDVSDISNVTFMRSIEDDEYEYAY